MILEMSIFCPPKIHATISKRKSPMLPQLIPPIIAIIIAILSSNTVLSLLFVELGIQFYYSQTVQNYSFTNQFTSVFTVISPPNVFPKKIIGNLSFGASSVSEASASSFSSSFLFSSSSAASSFSNGFDGYTPP